MHRSWLWAAIALVAVVWLTQALWVRCPDVPRGLLAQMVCEPQR